MEEFKDLLNSVKEMVEETLEYSDSWGTIDITSVEYDHDIVPYGMTDVRTPDYISSIEGELTFNDGPIVTVDEVKEWIGDDEEFNQYMRLVESSGDTAYEINPKLSGKYDGDNIDLADDIQGLSFKFDPKGNILPSKQNVTF